MYKIYDGKSNGKVIFTQEELDNIKESYLNGESSVKIGQRYNVSHKLILRKLKAMGIDADRTLSARVYHYDEHYFDNIDTPNKARILGFLYADGSNCLSKSTISMSLEECDYQALEDIRKELKSDKPLEYLDYSNKHDFGYNYKNQYRLLIFSKHMCETLESIGMVSNKSLVLTFPDIPEHLIPSFILGYFEGDGSLGVHDIEKAYKITSPKVSITSTENFCKTLSDIIQKNLGFTPIICDASCHNGITRSLNINKKDDAMKFLHWIYKDADIYLERKYKIYQYYANNSLIA